MEMGRTQVEDLWNPAGFWLFGDFAWNVPGFESSVEDLQKRMRTS